MKTFIEIINEAIQIKGTPINKRGIGIGGGYTYVITKKKDVSPKDDQYQMYIYYKNKPYIDIGSHPQKSGVPSGDAYSITSPLINYIKKYSSDKKKVKKMISDIESDKKLLGL